jgi:hypothetical protein
MLELAKAQIKTAKKVAEQAAADMAAKAEVDALDHEPTADSDTTDVG